MGRRELVRAGGMGAVRDRLRRPPPPGQAGPSRAVRGSPASQGLRPDDPRGEAVAGRSRGRGGRRVTLALLVATSKTGNFVTDFVHGFWLDLIVKTILV